ncbi:MAG: hypothetical protein J6Y19_10625, partial [Kiritimatiellae bacterium]|nr:hypothetical protein [Kiritimatiellia bacterium]
MSIQVNGNAPSINWEALLQQVGSLSQSAAAGQKPVLTFTTTEADGTQRTVSVNIPDDLSLPSTVDQAAIDSLCAKLAADPNLGLDARQIQQLHDDFTAALNAPGVQTSINSLGSSKSVMFDLYKLMALLVEVAQKQRDASRELRKTESEQIQASILAQAAQQRQTAKISMVASAICCAVQAGAMGLSLAKQASAFKTQMASLETSGVGSARENLTMLKAGESVDGARQQLAATRASVGNATATRVTACFSQAELSRANAQLKEIQIQDDTAKLQNLQNVNQPVRPADIPSHPDLETANTRLNEFHEMQELQNNQNRSPEQNTRLTELQNKFHNTTEAKLTNERNAASLDSANTRLNEFHEMQDLEGTQNRTQAQETRLAELQGKFQNVNENQLTTELNNARQQVVADLQHNIEANQTELTNARADANAKLNATLKTYEDAYDTAVRERANVSPKASKLEVRDLDANYDKA